MKFLGIDLAGSERNPSGICVLDKKLNVSTFLLFSDGEILKKVGEVRPEVIAIDAPLALPSGRPSLAAKWKHKGHFRACDKELLKMGIKFFPITLGAMRKLTKRGIKLKKILEKMGYRVIETYPGAVQDIMGWPRKAQGVEKLRSALKSWGFRGISKNATHHELDAICCAWVGKLYAEGNYLAIGKKDEIEMILPRKRNDSH